MGCINLVRGKVLSPKDLEHSAGALAEAQATGKYEISGNLGQGWMGSVPISALMGFEVERDYATGFKGAGVHSWPPNAPTNPHSGFSGRASATADAVNSCPHPEHFPDAIFPSL
jgi:hypothetical protein